MTQFLFIQSRSFKISMPISIWIHSLSLISLVGLVACGVKGDPKPPLTPASLGHGQPSFKRATKDLKPTAIVDPEATPIPKTQKSPSEQE